MCTLVILSTSIFINLQKRENVQFVGRVAKMVDALGKTPIGWDPIDTSPEINSRVILQNWKDSNEAARKKTENLGINYYRDSSIWS